MANEHDPNQDETILQYHPAAGLALTPVMLYVLTSHFPRNLLSPLLETGQAVATQHETVYDVTISTLKPVRFIICGRTDNPILALFSDKIERIVAGYTMIQSEPQLFADVSIYWKQILKGLC